MSIDLKKTTLSRNIEYLKNKTKGISEHCFIQLSIYVIL